MRNVRSVIVYSTITAMLSFQAVTGAGHHGHVTQVLAAAIEDSVPSAEPITAGVKDGLFAQASNVSATAGVAGVLPDLTEITASQAEEPQAEAAAVVADTVQSALHFAAGVNAADGSDTQPEIGVVNVEQYLNVRAEASTEAELVGRLYRGAGAYVQGTDGDWTEISSGDVTGWVLSDYLLTGENAEAQVGEISPNVATIVADNLCVREKADSESTVLTTLSNDMQFPVLATEGEWLKIQLTSETVGYVHSDYVAMNDGLFAGVTTSAETEIQADLDQRAAERQAQAEAAAKAEADAAARETSSEDNGSSSSSSKKNSSSSNSNSESSSSSSSSSSSNSGSSSSNSSSSSSSSESSSDSSSSASESSSDGWVSLGTFKITAYCPCSTCNGSNAGKTASGATPSPGWTIAADTSVLPMGTVVKIEGLGEREVQDTGVYGNTIDLLVSSHSDTYDWGVRYREVWVQR
ncbi:MAG: SH3 domain-containing protein [Lachnospiraceae bacterium]